MHMEGGALAPSRLEHAASAAAQSRSHAQAKAQGVADKTHARFSPSAANRRIHCPPSLLLEEQFEEGESVYAAEGTAGHALAEHLIRKHLKQRTTRPTSEYYKDELLEAVDDWRDGEAHGQGAVPLHPRPVRHETPWQADAGAGIRPARGCHCQHRPRGLRREGL